MIMPGGTGRLAEASAASSSLPSMASTFFDASAAPHRRIHNDGDSDDRSAGHLVDNDDEFFCRFLDGTDLMRSLLVRHGFTPPS